MKLENFEKIKNLQDSTSLKDGLSKKQKRDIVLLRDIAIENPSRLAYDRLLSLESNNPNFILSIIPENKLAIKYMSRTLKENEEFLTEVIEKYPEVIPDVLKCCNVSITPNGQVVLAEEKINLENEMYQQLKSSGVVSSNYSNYTNNEKIMTSMIERDAAMILFASEELKDNKDFIKVEAMKSDDTLNVIADNCDKFGTQGLIGAKEANREKSSNEFISKLEANLEQITSELRANGLTDEQIADDIMVKGIMASLNKLRGYEELDESSKDGAWDTYLNDMANSGDEDLLPDEIFHRAEIQDKICGELDKRKSKAEEQIISDSSDYSFTDFSDDGR